MELSPMNRILLFALYGLFIAGILGTVTLPFMLDVYARLFRGVYSLEPGYRTFLMVFLVAVALPGLWIIGEMIRMMRSITPGPFVVQNVSALRRCGCLLFVISAVFLVKCFTFFTFLSMACTFLFLICGFFAFTLADLFDRAVTYKDENDLTI